MEKKIHPTILELKQTHNIVASQEFLESIPLDARIVVSYEDLNSDTPTDELSDFSDIADYVAVVRHATRHDEVYIYTPSEYLED